MSTMQPIPAPLPGAAGVSAGSTNPGAGVRGRGRSGGVVLAVLAAAAVCLPLAVLAVVTPKFAAIFQDFGAALPGVSVLVMRAGLALGTAAGALAIVLIGLATFGAVLLGLRVHWAFGMMLVLLSCAWFMVSIGVGFVGFMLPLVSMVESMQQGGGGV